MYGSLAEGKQRVAWSLPRFKMGIIIVVAKPIARELMVNNTGMLDILPRVSVVHINGGYDEARAMQSGVLAQS